jgi:hypothetical protein
MKSKRMPSSPKAKQERDYEARRADPQLAETRVGPITLDWKINVTAIAAFFLSVFALLLQAMGYWEGAVTTLQPTENLYITTNGSVLHVGARMVYTNDGASGYNSVILGESVTLRLGQNEYKLWSENRGTFAVDNGEPVLVNSVDAAPFIVPAMQLVTHESYFAARERRSAAGRWKDRITREQFVRLLETEHARGEQKIDVTFQAKRRDISGLHAGKERMLSTRCSTTLDPDLISRLRNEGWASRACWKED